MSAEFAATARKSEQHGEEPGKDCACHKGTDSEAGVPRFLNGVVQPKLRVGRADDPLEREAHRVAEQVVQGDPVAPMSSAGGHAQRKCAECEEEDQEALRREVYEDDAEELQLEAEAGGPVAAGADRKSVV